MKQIIDNKQDVEIAKHCIQIANNTADIKNNKNTLEYISKQVSNHLPHQINDMEKKFLKKIAEIQLDFAACLSDFKLSINKWLIGIMVSILLLLLAVLVKR